MLSQAVIIQTQGGAKYSELRKTHSEVVKLVGHPALFWKALAQGITRLVSDDSVLWDCAS